ncbi:hypothetical protein [Bosea sp. PAMC 26642]|uniref:hypothetical protein n=1 Tax=Bosea sp. (strain PAMC 26642) TaxID=1792307 RepID=UPI000AAD556F|nr:hypothetical protein [Bosea sp. PAMC 26642]
MPIALGGLLLEQQASNGKTAPPEQNVVVLPSEPSKSTPAAIRKVRIVYPAPANP